MTTTRKPHHFGMFAFATLLGATAGCYGSELDAALDDVYVCNDDSDCALGFVCAASVCRDQAGGVGAELAIIDPPELAIFLEGQANTIPVTISGAGVTLTNGSSNAADAGYIDVTLDGVLVDTIVEGDLMTGITIASVPAPTTPGLHHIGLTARRVDGDVFDGEESVVSSAFWIDDGEEHVGIVHPAPGVQVDLAAEPLSLDIAALNFTFVNPGFIDPENFALAGEGYVHLYVDAEIPTCMPDCNFEHQSVITPPGLTRLNRLVVDRGVILPGEIGSAKIQIVAQDLQQEPYYRDETAAELVFHEVRVQSVLQGSGEQDVQH